MQGQGSVHYNHIFWIVTVIIITEISMLCVVSPWHHRETLWIWLQQGTGQNTSAGVVLWRYWHGGANCWTNSQQVMWDMELCRDPDQDKHQEIEETDWTNKLHFVSIQIDAGIHEHTQIRNCCWCYFIFHCVIMLHLAILQVEHPTPKTEYHYL